MINKADTRPWLIYTRVSTDDQEDEGVSLASQEDSCRAYARARAWTVTELISDSETGRKSKRPGYQRLLKLLRDGEHAGVIAWKFKRLTRDVRDAYTLMDVLEAANAGMVTVVEHWDTTTPMGRAMIGVGSIFSQLEAEETGVQTKAAMRWLKTNGYFAGGPVPAGCKVISVDDGKRRKLVRGSGADDIEAAAGRILAGQSLREVSDHLNLERVPHLCRNKPTRWTPVSVRSTLLSPRVAGVLIGSDIQAKIRAELAGRDSPVRRQKGFGGRSNTKPDRASPIAGLVRCPSCDRSMIQTTGTGRAGIKYFYFRCCGRSKTACQQKDLRCEPLEAAVLKGLVEAVEPGSEYEDLLRERFQSAKVNAQRAVGERVALTSKRDQLAARIKDMALNQQISSPGWSEALRVIGEELRTTDRKLADLAGIIAAATVDVDNIDVALAEVARGITALKDESLDAQRQTISALVAAVRIEAGFLVLDLYEPQSNEPAGVPPVRAIIPDWVPTPYGKRTVRVRIPWLLPGPAGRFGAGGVKPATTPAGTC